MSKKPFNESWLVGWQARLRRYRLLVRLVWLQVRSGKHLIVVLRAGGLGDIIATFPACQRLVEAHPKSELVYITHPHYAPLFEMAAFPVTVLADVQCTLPAFAFRLFHLYQFIWADDKTIEAKANFIDEFALSCGLPVVPEEAPRLNPSPQLLDEIRQKADELTGGRPLITLHAGPTSQVKEWSREKWLELIELLQPLDVVLMQIGQNYHTRWGKVDTGHFPGTIDQLDQLSMVETACWIAASDCFLGVDSGPLHFAAAMGTPRVALMGPTEMKFLFRASPKMVQVSAKEVPCLGCHHRVPRLHWHTGCPFAIACMASLQPQDVVDQVRRLLNLKRAIAP